MVYRGTKFRGTGTAEVTAVTVFYGFIENRDTINTATVK